jgi:hypothetical protein
MLRRRGIRGGFFRISVAHLEVNGGQARRDVMKAGSLFVSGCIGQRSKVFDLEHGRVRNSL